MKLQDLFAIIDHAPDVQMNIATFAIKFLQASDTLDASASCCCCCCI